MLVIVWVVHHYMKIIGFSFCMGCAYVQKDDQC